MCADTSISLSGGKQIASRYWHVEIYPVMEPMSGLERGYGIHLNNISPEDAAKKLGVTCRKELAILV